MIETVEETYPAVRRRLSAPSDFATVTARLEALLGRMDLGLLERLPDYQGRPEALRERLQSMAGPSGFALFSKVDHGRLLAALLGAPTRAVAYVFGNALIAIEMTRHAPLVGLYVPPRLYVDEPKPGTTRLTYEVPSATFAAFANAAAMEVARDLDAKIDALARAALTG